jgi:hypothetical protein
MDKTSVTKHTTCDIKYFSINNVIFIYNIKGPTKCIVVMESPYFSFHMQFLQI